MFFILTKQSHLETVWQRHGDSRGCYRRVCLSCGHPFFAIRPEARHCRAACRQRAYRRRLRARRVVLALFEEENRRPPAGHREQAIPTS
jgi:hypothetical protein